MKKLLTLIFILTSTIVCGQTVYTQNPGLTLEQPRPLTILTNNFPYPVILGNGDDVWVGSSGWDGVQQSPPYTGTSKIERFNRKTGTLIASITNGPYYNNGQFQTFQRKHQLL